MTKELKSKKITQQEIAKKLNWKCKLLEYKNVKVTFNNFQKTIYKELGQPYE